MRRLTKRLRWASLAATLAPVFASVATAAESARPLAITLDGRTVNVRSCRTAACETHAFTLPEGLGGGRVESLTLEGGRAAALVESSPAVGEGRYILLLANGDDGEPRELLRGFVDRPVGAPGERQTRVLVREPSRGGESIAYGTRYESVNVCGRQPLLRVKKLDTTSLDWSVAPSRVVPVREREAAARLFASRSAQPIEGRPRLLVSSVATSAVGASHSGLTDGTLEHVWAENVEGAGEGEAVVLSSSSDVPILGFSFAVKPRGGVELASPRSFVVVSDTESFLVTLPEDASAQPEGTTYEVTLAAPLRSECIGVVLDSAYVGKGAPVGFAEFRAMTALDARGDVAALVGMLDAPGEDARAAEAVLSRSGATAVAAAMAGFDKLGDAGRERALDVIDSGTCNETTAFFAERLVGRGRSRTWDSDGDESQDALRERVRRCRPEATRVLSELTTSGSDDRERGLAARELAAIAPAAAVPVVARAFEGASANLRGRLRDAMAAAAIDARGRAATVAALEPAAFAARAPAVQLELLRALVPRLPELPQAREAFASVVGDTSLRTRYLLQEPARALALHGDPKARAFLRDSLSRDDSADNRAAAARASRDIAELTEPLRAALEDRVPRVREAALEALATLNAPSSTPRVVELLAGDPWTFVRVAAASALGAQSPTDASSRALVRALDDHSVLVRRAALLAIGAARVPSAGERVAALADDPREDTDVRVAALAALGRTCHMDALDVLYKLALRTGAPELGYDRQLGLAALGALAELRPTDRGERLAPLLREGRAPEQVKAIVREVIARTGRCGR